MKNNSDGFQDLGRKALCLTLLRWSAPALGILVIEIALIVLQFVEKNNIAYSTTSSITTFMHQYPVTDVLLNEAIAWVLLAFVVVFIVGITLGYLTFIGFHYRITENGFAMRRGLISREELSLPFRQIQNIDLEQSFLYRIISACDLVILTAGHEDKEYAEKNQSEIVLTAIDFKVAKDLQHRLLERSNIQEVVAVEEPEDMKMEQIQTPQTPLSTPENK